MDDQTRQVTRLWTLAQPRVAAFVTAVVRDFQDRDDLIQDIAVSVFESFDRYDDSRPFDTRALGVARNQFKVYLRKRRKKIQMFDADTMECLENAFAEIPTEKVRALDYLQECVQKLDDKGKKLCELRYAEGMKPAMITDILKLPGTAVRKALQRIREQLRVCVERKASTETIGA
jgi:RNA polymerase sigma-70 factor (ECF subfamily)